MKRFEMAPALIVAILSLALLIALPVLPSISIVLLATALIGIGAYRLGNNVVAVLSAAFVTRLSLIMVNEFISIFPTPSIGPIHSNNAAAVAHAWMQLQIFEGLPETGVMRTIVAHILAPFYLLIGSSPIAGRIGIAFLSLVIGVIVYLFAARLSNRRTAVLATIAVLFWPTILYRSVAIQREILVVVLMLVLLYSVCLCLDRISIIRVAAIVASTLLIVGIREENLFIIGAVLGAALFARSKEQPEYVLGVGMLAAPVMAFFALNFGTFTGYGNSVTPQAIDAFAYGRAHGDAAYLVGLHYDSWLDIALYAPIKVVYFLFTPFPWQIRGPVELIVGFSAIALVFATLLARRGIAILMSESDHLIVLLTYLIVGVLCYSIVEMNYGAAVRRRIQFVPIILLLAIVGLSKLDIRLRGIRH